MYTLHEISQIVWHLFAPVDSFQNDEKIKLYHQPFRLLDIAKLLIIYSFALAFSLILGHLH